MSPCHPLPRRGFTLTEILIVIALIVLITAMALPAFNFITGGRSVDAAMNQISAVLARARSEAIGLQEVCGVMFYYDPTTGRQMMAVVKQSDSKGTVDTTTDPTADVWLDADSDADNVPLPRGVGVEVNNDASANTNQIDRYLGYNPWSITMGGGPVTSIPIGGVILFDAHGKLASLHYGFHMSSVTTASSGAPPTQLAQLFIPKSFALDPVNGNVTDFSENPKTGLNGSAPLSSFGFVVFDGEALTNVVGDYKPDSIIQGTALSGAEKSEENWLDNNASPVLINHYNGTLMRGD